MPTCPSCHHATAMRHGHARAGRQRFLCNGCRRTFTADSATAFAGYHWPAEVILTAVRWSLAHPLSGTSVMVLLAERGIDVSPRTVLRWVQTFGPLLAAGELAPEDVLTGAVSPGRAVQEIQAGDAPAARAARRRRSRATT